MPYHIRAEAGEVAPYVLLPGDPNRATYIAETFLENPKRYTDYRLMYGYTGTYKGVRVSVQTTGMGCPSASIAAEELAMLGARVLVRVGTTGGLHPDLQPGDLVVAQASLPLDGTTRQYLGDTPHVPLPSYRVLKANVDAAERAGVRHTVGLIASEDAFYAPQVEKLRGLGVVSVEMEASAIFTVARLRGLEAACLLTVSNALGDPTPTPDAVLKRGVDEMVGVALESVVALERERPLGA